MEILFDVFISTIDKFYQILICLKRGWKNGRYGTLLKTRFWGSLNSKGAKKNGVWLPEKWKKNFRLLEELENSVEKGKIALS
jgi:hypothetical protein